MKMSGIFSLPNSHDRDSGPVRVFDVAPRRRCHRDAVPSRRRCGVIAAPSRRGTVTVSSRRRRGADAVPSRRRRDAAPTPRRPAAAFDRRPTTGRSSGRYVQPPAAPPRPGKQRRAAPRTQRQVRGGAGRPRARRVERPADALFRVALRHEGVLRRGGSRRPGRREVARGYGVPATPTQSRPYEHRCC